MSRTDKSIETKRLEVARIWGRGDRELRNTKFLFGVMELFWSQIVVIAI